MSPTEVQRTHEDNISLFDKGTIGDWWSIWRVAVPVPVHMALFSPSLSLALSPTSFSLFLLSLIYPLIPHCEGGKGGWTVGWCRRNQRSRSGQCWRWLAGLEGSTWAGCVWRTCQSFLLLCRPVWVCEREGGGRGRDRDMADIRR